MEALAHRIGLLVHRGVRGPVLAPFGGPCHGELLRLERQVLSAARLVRLSDARASPLGRGRRGLGVIIA
eukprot:6119775-Pyramimonas_sp.AAC.1